MVLLEDLEKRVLDLEQLLNSSLTRGETLRSELDSSLQWEKYTEENSDQLFLIVMGIIIFCKYILFSTKTLGTECMH
jgi:hypothetical protein